MPPTQIGLIFLLILAIGSAVIFAFAWNKARKRMEQLETAIDLTKTLEDAVTMVKSFDSGSFSQSLMPKSWMDEPKPRRTFADSVLPVHQRGLNRWLKIVDALLEHQAKFYQIITHPNTHNGNADAWAFEIKLAGKPVKYSEYIYETSNAAFEAATAIVKEDVQTSLDIIKSRYPEN